MLHEIISFWPSLYRLYDPVACSDTLLTHKSVMNIQSEDVSGGKDEEEGFARCLRSTASISTLSSIHHICGMYCWFKQNCWSVMQIFVSLLCTELPGIGMCRPSVRMWVIWELANTAVVSTGLRLWFKNHIQTDIIVRFHLTYGGPRMRHTHSHTITNTQRFTFHPTQ